MLLVVELAEEMEEADVLLRWWWCGYKLSEGSGL